MRLGQLHDVRIHLPLGCRASVGGLGQHAARVAHPRYAEALLLQQHGSGNATAAVRHPLAGYATLDAQGDLPDRSCEGLVRRALAALAALAARSLAIERLPRGAHERLGHVPCHALAMYAYAAADRHQRCARRTQILCHARVLLVEAKHALAQLCVKHAARARVVAVRQRGKAFGRVHAHALHRRVHPRRPICDGFRGRSCG